MKNNNLVRLQLFTLNFTSIIVISSNSVFRASAFEIDRKADATLDKFYKEVSAAV